MICDWTLYESASVYSVCPQLITSSVFGSIFKGCESDTSRPVWYPTVLDCRLSALDDKTVATSAMVVQSRALALCEAIASATTCTFPIPQQHLQQIQQQKLPAGFVFPTEAALDLIIRFTSVTIDNVIVNNNKQSSINIIK